MQCPTRGACACVRSLEEPGALDMIYDRVYPRQLEAEGCPRIPLPAEASPASIAGLLESPPLDFQRGMETLHRKAHRWFCAAAG